MNTETLTCAEGAFKCTPTLEGQTLRLHLKGEADLEATDAIRRILEAAHAEAQRLAAAEVTIDLSQLEFMNSSSIKHFVSWLRSASRLEEHAYKIRIISSPTFSWQKRSLNALRGFAPKLLTIDTAAA